MKGETKTKKQLLEELAQLRQRIAELEAAGGQLSVFPRDVTERKRAEETLRESEERYRNALDSMLQGFQIIDYDWRYLYLNDTAVAHGQRTKEELLGHTIMESYPGVEETGMFAALRRCMDERTPHRMENEFTYPDGSKASFELSIHPVPEGICVLSLDITERKQTEEALREANEALRAVVQSSPLAIITVDRENRVTSWNAAAERMFGWSESEVLGGLKPEIPEEKAAEYEEVRRRIVGGEPLIRFETVRRTNAGSVLHVGVTAGPLFDAEGQVGGLIGILEDITDRMRAEETLQQTEHQLLQAQKMEAIGNLAGGVAHDFNNLLTVILGHSQLMLEPLDERDPLRRGMEQIHEAGERAAALTRQLLAFGRRQVLRAEVQDLNTIVANIEPMLRRIIGEDIDLVFVPGVELGWVKVDEGQIEQVIMNLATNARDAMPKGGKLTIETTNVYLDEGYARRHVAVTPGPHVMLAVSDTGAGMDKETQSHIFEPFFTTKEHDKGTGLGLSTVYGIVKQSEGNIWVYSEPGNGTTFKIYLPRTEDKPEPEQPSAVREERLGGTETLLVVEDDEAVRELVCQVCESSGYTLLIARNAGEALLTCERYRGKIDLMVTDVVMPGMGGPELAERLAPTHPEMKVLFMSGYTANAIVHHGVLDPGTPFLQKPFAPHALARKVREVLDAP